MSPRDAVGLAVIATFLQGVAVGLLALRLFEARDEMATMQAEWDTCRQQRDDLGDSVVRCYDTWVAVDKANPCNQEITRTVECVMANQDDPVGCL